ncbi:hypothetical protein D3C71_1867460 [compost metagenome]
MACGAQGHTVVVFDVIGVVVIVARHEHRARRAGVRAPRDAGAGQVFAAGIVQHRFAGEVVHLRHDGATHLHRIVLLGFRPEIRHMVG